MEREEACNDSWLGRDGFSLRSVSSRESGYEGMFKEDTTLELEEVHGVCSKPMTEALISHYKLPEHVVEFLPAKEETRESPASPLPDDLVRFLARTASSLIKECGTVGSAVRVPFDPDKTVDLLRRERYVDRVESWLWGKAPSSLYYFFRPWLPIPIRKHLQRLFYYGWRERSFPRWPVDTTVEQLFEKLLALSMRNQGLTSIPFIWFWPDGYRGCVMLTHDVESRQGAALIPQLMDVDQEYGIPASFQLIPEGAYAWTPDLLSRIRGRGFELNLHDLRHDGNLFSDEGQFREKACAINRYAAEYGTQGFRSGRMYRNPDWYDALEVSYDMSIPNVAHLDPQGGGCCTVFPYFIGGILELPLTTIQDYTLLHVLGECSTNLWKQQIELILQRHGLMSFIIHPDFIMEKGAIEVYHALLAHLRELQHGRNIWTALPGDINQWWRLRHRMILVQSHGTWSIEGEGKERARLAYARLVDDRIQYTME